MSNNKNGSGFRVPGSELKHKIISAGQNAKAKKEGLKEFNPKPGTGNPEPLLIGLTGPICSGKTTAADYLRQLGYHVIDVDKFAHTLYLKGTPLYKKLVKKYGKGTLDAGGEINRKALRTKAFKNVKNYKEFVRVIYPAMNSALSRAVKLAGSGVVILDMAVLFESGFYKKTGAVIYIQPGEKVLKKALSKRGHRKVVEKIAGFQSLFSPAKKISLSDAVIHNNATIQKLQQGVKKALSGIL